jgi:hypothetical protein
MMSAGQYAYAVEADTESYKEQPKKKVKSNFIAKWLLNKIKQEVKQEENMNYGNQVSAKAPGLSIGGPSIDQPDRAIQFTVYNANGGRVVETRRYDRKTDRNTNGLYIITSEQDFGKEIDKIITMEALKS